VKSTIQFETPENVQVEYEIAGLGSRFVAWVEDQLLIFLIMLVFYVALLFIGAGSAWVRENILDDSSGSDLPLYLFGLATLVMGFTNLVYFSASELLMRGQTLGKRHAHIRVVKANGFALDAGSILLRNVFRVLDQIPVMWVVPALSPRSQRIGDMVSGTVCVADEPKNLATLREVLLARPLTDRVFRFDVGALSRARPGDFAAVEKVLENFDSMPIERQQILLEKMCVPLAQRLKVPEPEVDQRRRFLEDLMAAEYRRQQRQLG